MIKAELIKKIVQETDLETKVVERILGALIKQINLGVAEGKKVEVPGLGIFSVNE